MRKMKDPGVEWLGDVPDDWQVKPHWAFTKEKKVPVGSLHSELTLLSLTKRGVIVRDLEAGGKFPSNFEGYQQVAPNDLVLCLFDIEETPRTVGLAPTEGMITSAYTLMRVTGINPYFLEWYLIGMDNEKRFKPFYSGLRNTLQKPIFGSIRFAVPPPREQAQIVGYLDKETSQINTLISKKEQLIEKLLERRQALITQVVTKGLDPNVPMKDSGVESLGMIPASWSVTPLGRVLSSAVVDGPHTTPKFVDEGLPFLSVDAIVDGQLLELHTRLVSPSDFHLFRRKACPQRGDILMGKAASIGKIARVKTDWEFAIWSPLALLKIDKDRADAGFVEFSLKSEPTQFQINSLASANTQQNLSMSKIPALRIALPAKDEQIQAAAYLESRVGDIDTLVEKTRKAIELLKERRQALITQVVTGKIDVRGFADGNS